MIDFDKLRRTEWVPRTREVSASALGAGQTWIVRQPTANELAIANESKEKRMRLDAMVTAMERGDRSEIITEMRGALGLSDDIRPDIARRIELLTRCSMDPLCREEDAVWLGEKHPVLFYQLTNAILELGDQGAEAKKKPSASTAIQESATH